MDTRLLFSLPAFFTLISALLPTAEASGAPLLSPSVIFNQGFCSDGAYGGTPWPGGKRPRDVIAWGSFCEAGDNNVGRLETQEFLAPATLNLYLAGYPGLPDRRLILRNAQSGEETELRPQTAPHEQWQPNTLPVPSGWIGKPVRLIAEDRATGFRLARLHSSSAAGIFTLAPHRHPRAAERILRQRRISRHKMAGQHSAAGHRGFGFIL